MNLPALPPAGENLSKWAYDEYDEYDMRNYARQAQREAVAAKDRQIALLEEALRDKYPAASHNIKGAKVKPNERWLCLECTSSGRGVHAVGCSQVGKPELS